jgi:hypothetical protein
VPGKAGILEDWAQSAWPLDTSLQNNCGGNGYRSKTRSLNQDLGKTWPQNLTLALNPGHSMGEIILFCLVLRATSLLGRLSTP